jgi:hypothetical protein
MKDIKKVSTGAEMKGDSKALGYMRVDNLLGSDFETISAVRQQILG